MNKYIIFTIALVFTIVGTSSNISIVRAEEGDAMVPVLAGSNASEDGPVTEANNAPEASAIIPEGNGPASDTGPIIPNTGGSATNEPGPIIPNTGGSATNESSAIIPNTVGANDDEGTLQTPPNNGGGGNGGGGNNGNGSGPSSSGSTGSTGSGGSFVGTRSFVPVTIVASCPLITDYLKMGGTNDQSQVQKLQTFLKNVEKLDVDVNGTFDAKTDAAVKAFQTKYLSSILGPWDATRATGFVYITTLKKINEIACASAFALNADEQAIIDAYKRAQTGEQSTGVTPEGQTPATGTIEVGTNTTTNEDNANVAAVGQSSILSRFWKFITELFR